MSIQKFIIFQLLKKLKLKIWPDCLCEKGLINSEFINGSFGGSYLISSSDWSGWCCRFPVLFAPPLNFGYYIFYSFGSFGKLGF
jgi:hypothetical protein